jgi:hypothetical protein
VAVRKTQYEKVCTINVTVLAVAQTIVARAQGCSSISVNAGKHANLPDFAVCKGTDLLAVSQQVAPLDLPGMLVV